MDIKIIYEDDDILAVNKPAGLLVHGAENSKETTLVDWLIKNYPEIKNVGERPAFGEARPDLSGRPGIVHRLDKDTSGILLIAKNQRTFGYLKEQFKNRKIKKKYIALVCGKLNPPTGGEGGIIDLPIAKSKSDFRKKTSVGKMAGKIREAVTEYKVIKKFPACADRPEYTLVEVFPKTGRTHQIRVHFKSIGHPVVCDKLYGFKKAVCPFGLKRHFLHASSLELNLPSGARIKLEADLPDDLQAALTKLEKGI